MNATKVPDLLVGVGVFISHWKWDGKITVNGRPVGYYSLSAIPTEIDVQRHIASLGPKHEFRLTARFNVHAADGKQMRAIRARLHEVAEQLFAGQMSGPILALPAWDGKREVIGSYEMKK